MNSRVAVEIMGWTVERNRLGMSWWKGSGTFPGQPPFAIDDDFTPTTDLNHAKMAYHAAEKLIGDYVLAQHMMRYWETNSPDDVGYLSYFLDPLKLCEAMLAAKGGG